MMYKIFLPLVLLSAAIFSSSVYAAADYADRADVKSFAENFAKKYKQDPDAIYALLLKAKKQQAIIDAISRPAERVLTWGDYRRIFIDENRLVKGVEFWQEHRALIDEVSEKYQVAPEIIVAIIGVETRYGKITGNYKVLDALATLSFDYPPRAKFFSGQLEQYILLSQEQKLDPLSLKGSYAGAMGYGQFIPGSYRAYAVDYDKDGVADIWQNPVDAIASVANYFTEHRWQYGNLVATQLVHQDIDENIISKGLKPDTTIKALRKAGVVVPKELDDAIEVSLMRHETPRGIEYWLGFHNFYVITRYNHSSMYALAAFQLSQLLKARLEGL